jgi:hypothetical protein
MRDALNREAEERAGTNRTVKAVREILAEHFAGVSEEVAQKAGDTMAAIMDSALTEMRGMMEGVVLNLRQEVDRLTKLVEARTPEEDPTRVSGGKGKK